MRMTCLPGSSRLPGVVPKHRLCRKSSTSIYYVATSVNPPPRLGCRHRSARPVLASTWKRRGIEGIPFRASIFGDEHDRRYNTISEGCRVRGSEHTQSIELQVSKASQEHANYPQGVCRTSYGDVANDTAHKMSALSRVPRSDPRCCSSAHINKSNGQPRASFRTSYQQSVSVKAFDIKHRPKHDVCKQTSAFLVFLFLFRPVAYHATRPLYVSRPTTAGHVDSIASPNVCVYTQ